MRKFQKLIVSLLKGFFYEDNELSRKSIVTAVLIWMFVDTYVNKIRGCDDVSEGVIYFAGELLTGLFVTLGIAMWNKRKEFRKSTNNPTIEEDNSP